MTTEMWPEPAGSLIAEGAYVQVVLYAQRRPASEQAALVRRYLTSGWSSTGGPAPTAYRIVRPGYELTIHLSPAGLAALVPDSREAEIARLRAELAALQGVEVEP